jgi:hypothetical protein
VTDVQPVHHLKPLSPIIGRWASRGETIGTDDEPSISIIGTDVYTWLAGGQFIEHRVHVRMGDDIVEVLEVIGGHEGSGFAMRSFDNEGTFTEMQGTVRDDGTMAFTGDTIRTTLTVADDGQAMHARWERSEGGRAWAHWMNMDFTRI